MKLMPKVTLKAPIDIISVICIFNCTFWSNLFYHSSFHPFLRNFFRVTTMQLTESTFFPNNLQNSPGLLFLLLTWTLFQPPVFLSTRLIILQKLSENLCENCENFKCLWRGKENDEEKEVSTMIKTHFLVNNSSIKQKGIHPNWRDSDSKYQYQWVLPLLKMDIAMQFII